MNLFKRKNILFSASLPLLGALLLAPVAEPSATAFDYTLTTNERIISSKTEEEFDDFTIFEDTKYLPNGDLYKAFKYEFSSDLDESVIVEIPTKSKTGDVVYYDYDKEEWVFLDVLDELPKEILYFRLDKEEFLICPAFTYKDVDFASLEEVTNAVNDIYFTVNDDGFLVINIELDSLEDTSSQFWYLNSKEELLPIHEPVIKLIWATYNNLESHRWTYDGYFYETPSSYTPYSEDMFWRNPSSYLTTAFTFTNNSRAAIDLSYAMLDTIITYREDEGYFLTYPESTDFLQKDYGVDAGFYDTRFNSDITKTLLKSYEQTGDLRFLNAALENLEFFLYFANNHNFDVTKDGKYGILVEDYYHENGDYSKTHSSLNHHVAEIVVLLEAYKITGDERYLELSEVMMQGIRNTEEMWIKPDNSLEYAYMPDGTMGLLDYPYLTYNDLFELVKLREELGFSYDSTLNNLMYHKKLHMDANGITGYKK